MSKILVTGASGHLGQLVVKHLLETEKVAAADIIATTRKVESLAHLAAQGVDVRAADFADVASLQTAFAGAARILIISTDGIGERLAQHKNAIAAAQAVGVQHIVYTSMPAPATSLVSFAPEHLGTEQALAASGLTSTILRNSWYFENILHSATDWLAKGQAYTAAADGKLSHIAREDLARAAAAALASSSVENATYTLTGAQAFTTKEIVDLVGATAGKTIETIHIGLDDAVKGALEAGLPQPVAEMFASFDANIANGGFAQVTNDFAQLTGRQPVAFADWLQANKAALSV